MLWVLAKALVIMKVAALQFEGENPDVAALQFAGEHPDSKHHQKHRAKHVQDEEVVHFASGVKEQKNSDEEEEKDETEVADSQKKTKTSKKKAKKTVMKNAAKKLKAKKTIAKHWSYENTKHWETEFPSCRKDGQSPIALHTKCADNEVGCTPSSQPLGNHVTFETVAGAYLSNNGRFLELVAPAHFSTVTLGDLVWKSGRVQFHTPSEHTMNGERFPAEMQIVYKPVGHNKWTLITSILIKEDPTMNRNEFLSSLGFDMLNLPRGEGDKMYLGSPVDLKEGLKTSMGSGFAGYEGTLTSPPCTKDVLWFIAEDPMEASATQIGNLERRFPKGNNRPLYPIGSRMIYRDFSHWSSHAKGWSMISVLSTMLLFAANY
jgi:carbonic anhydrase